MPSLTKDRKVLLAVLLAVLFAAGFAAAPAAAEEAAPAGLAEPLPAAAPSAGASSHRGGAAPGSAEGEAAGGISAAYLDAGALGSGIAYSAFHLRAGAAFPLAGRDSWGLEAELYWTRPDDLAFFQADALGLYRRRLGGGRFFLGAGAGLGFSRAAYAESSGGAGAYLETRIKAIILAEAGYALGLFRPRLYLEPFVRAFAAAGPDSRSGSDLGAGEDLAGCSATASGEAGLRLGWRF